jgi:tetratricopeptide (TPR) repeat protein
MIAKPWLGEIHIHGLKTPHRVLAHELAHAVAAQFGSEWLGISARYELLPNMGFIEGLAMAFTPPMHDSSLHVYAASMRKQGRAPDLSAILGAEGFYRYAAGRAYNIAGSFIRYLLDTYGAESVKRAYPRADFEAAFAKPLPALVSEWETFLDNLEVSLPEKRAATERFRRPSIFERPCAHVVAELKRQARAAKAQDAVAIYRELCGFEGNTPSSRLALAKALKRAGDTPAFKTLAQSLINEGSLNPTQLSELQELLGTVAWSSGNLETARDAFRAAFELRNRLTRQRLQWFKLHTLDYPEPKRSKLMSYLDQKLKTPLEKLTEFHTEAPEDPAVAYLLARLHYNKAQYEKAIDTFGVMTKHPFEPIEAERWRLIADSYWRLGKLEKSREYFLRFANEFAPNSGEQERGLDWVERVEWAIESGITPYPPKPSPPTE